MQAIGIDIGTTSICGVAIDVETGDLIHSITLKNDSFINSSFPWERIQSPDIIIKTVIKVLNALIRNDTVSIGVTGQMHGILYTDKNGDAISPLYTWQDMRGDLPYKDTTYAKHLNSYSGYGNVTHFYNTVNGIAPLNYLGFCTIHDYVVMKLCGINKAVVHPTSAASFGLYDITSNSFNTECNIDILDGYQAVGKYNGIPVGIAIGDNQASVFSSLASNDDILINIGTGSQVSLISDSPKTAAGIETRPYFEGKYLVVGSGLCGGRAYACLKDLYKLTLSYVKQLDDDNIYEIMNQMLDGCSHSTLTVDTRFSGTRENPFIRGSITGISTDNLTPPQLTYGVLEGMIRELHEMYTNINESRIGIVASGNGIRNNSHLQRICEIIFKGQVKIPIHTEEASFGAAMFGMICAGIHSGYDEVKQYIKYK